MSALPLLYLLLVVVVVVCAAVYQHKQTAKRHQLLQQFALSQGWTWVPEDDSWTERLHGTPFGIGDHRRAENVLQGSFRGHPMVAFDYSYQTHSSNGKGGSSTETHRFALCSLRLPDLVPELVLTPESALDRLGAAIGMQDIELESEDFNRRYRVRCDNPKFASDVLPPRTMQALLSRTALHLRLSRADAFCWEQGRHDPVQLLARLDALATLVDGIPAFVWTDLKGSPS